MKGLPEREKAFEGEFKRSQELAYRVSVHRNRLFGLWAASRLGLPSREAEAYAEAVIVAAFEEVGEDNVIRKVFRDFTGKGIAIFEPQLRAEFGRALTEARRQLSIS